MGIGERIKAARIKRGLTQKQLGNLCGMADSAIRRYESDRGNPTEKTIQRIALALNMEPWELRGYDGSIRVNVSQEKQSKDEFEEKLKKLSEAARASLQIQLSSITEDLSYGDLETIVKYAQFIQSQAQQPPQSPPVPQEGVSTTPPPDAPETPPEGE